MLWTKRVFLGAVFTALIASNVLTLTHSAFNLALSGLISTAFGVQTISDVLHNKLNAKNKRIKNHKTAAIKRKIATRKFGARLTSRTKRVAAESLAAIPAEAIPFVGLGILIAGTSYELYEACNSITDLDQLYLEMGMKDETPEDVLHSVCNPTMPDAALIWEDVLDKSGEWLGNVVP